MAETAFTYASDTVPDETIDVVVIGGGAAGLNGALMLARSRRSVVVIDSGEPRNAPAEAMHGFLVLDGTPPAQLLERGRQQVRHYGGRVVYATVASTAPAAPSPDGDPRFTATLTDGRTLTARRVLVATGLRDVLPDVPGLAQHWGHGVVHCPYCHGWEVRDEPIGIIATGPVSIHHALLFRQLTGDLVFFTGDTDLDRDTRARFAARDITVVDTPVAEVVTAADGTLTGVRLTDGRVVARRVLAVATHMRARTAGLEQLELPMEDLPDNMGRRFSSGMAGATDVPGVWVAGNATDLAAQVGASAAAGALAGAHINAMLATADTDAALAAMRATT
ncbi:NAD(P)/FAD-dependent oxidoreductase [Nocardia otitidiscaviarum]|uniref:NAD(P)/FAD-dependent oxidoreductase n=1 Tax=Nocardia otitidiscaviarum TaxID=1823 RepID=A0A516NKP5_9NOCA|nr:NAD(P)/FAD-dependent oxidoreductase [Nocardia otitidiscaviarum]MCP9623600.1 NAD(P)/FAD-dependent oxidoreductase [Nocardia otitidiscaviarum]QDP79476.1 NAD(P)/FAD-dependent oxidoreductase [Nocardia otitidiscaviarum]